MKLSEAEFYRNLCRILFPLPRSIMGAGFRKSLEIISEHIPFEKIFFKTGEDVHDWTIPDEWVIRNATLTDPDGKILCDFADNNLSVVNYSIAIDENLTLEELEPFLHTCQHLEFATPYVTSYYYRTWGFCIPLHRKRELKPGYYHAYIDSEHKSGELIVGEKFVPGISDEEVLLSTYLCHPSMAINELSGPLVMIAIYKKMMSMSRLGMGVRFVICPENIGSVAFLSKRGSHLLDYCVGGLVLTCLANSEVFTYKKPRNNASKFNRITLNLLENSGFNFRILEFTPDGSDERQYCSPGYDLPMGVLMGDGYGNYPEYHTDADTIDLIDFSLIEKYADFCVLTIEMLCKNKVYNIKVAYGTPQLSKCPIDLYPKMMTFNSENKPAIDDTRVILELLNWCDGVKDLITVCEERKLCFRSAAIIAETLESAGYLVVEGMSH